MAVPSTVVKSAAMGSGLGAPVDVPMIPDAGTDSDTWKIASANPASGSSTWTSLMAMTRSLSTMFACASSRTRVAFDGLNS